MSVWVYIYIYIYIGSVLSGSLINLPPGTNRTYLLTQFHVFLVSLIRSNEGEEINANSHKDMGMISNSRIYFANGITIP